MHNIPKKEKGLQKGNSSTEEDDETCEFVKVTPPVENGSDVKKERRKPQSRQK